MTKQPALIVDLDGTLTDCTHRMHLFRNRGKGRDALVPFFQAMGADAVYPWCRTLMDALRAQGFAIVLLTGRPEIYRGLTEDWLTRHGIAYDLLLMRPADDRRPGAEVKREIYRRDILPLYDAQMALDDNPKIAAMWADETVPCLLFGTGNEISV